MEISKRWLHTFCLLFIVFSVFYFGSRLVTQNVFDLPLFVTILFNIICYCIILLFKNQLMITHSSNRDLTKEKLMLEIAQLSRPPISSIVSVAVSIATVLILYFTGAFDLKEKTLKYETAKLEFEKVQLTNEKGKINFQLDSLRSSLDIVRKEYEQSVVIKIRLDQIIANLRDQKNSDKTRIVELEEEQVKIKSALDSSKKELSKQYPYFSKTPYEQQRIFVQAMNEKEQTIEDLRRELNFCKDSISRRLFRL